VRQTPEMISGFRREEDEICAAFSVNSLLGFLKPWKRDR